MSTFRIGSERLSARFEGVEVVASEIGGGKVVTVVVSREALEDLEEAGSLAQEKWLEAYRSHSARIGHAVSRAAEAAEAGTTVVLASRDV